MKSSKELSVVHLESEFTFLRAISFLFLYFLSAAVSRSSIRTLGCLALRAYFR